ncbi:hypothetical protein CDC45_22785 (plasmid) [Ralstonia pseudosolanacearum]|nr:hypothetical protein CDC45_22785 [Ralstonia pseudosolanacearum]
MCALIRFYRQICTEVHGCGQRRTGKNPTQLANFCAGIATYWRCSASGAASLFRFPASCRSPRMKVSDISAYIF